MTRLVTGPRAADEALGGRPGQLAVVYVQRGAGRRALRELVQHARRRGVRVEERSRDELDRLAGGSRHQGVIAVAGDYPYVDPEDLLGDARAGGLVVALDCITDPHNLGAIVRSAVVFGVDGILIPQRRSASVTPAVVRSSAGATEHARIARCTNLARTLRTFAEREMQIVGLADEARDELRDLAPAEGGRVVVVGSEGRGLRRLVRESCHRLVRIPLAGPVGSLNASVAAGIAIYETSRSHRQQPHREQRPSRGNGRARRR